MRGMCGKALYYGTTQFSPIYSGIVCTNDAPVKQRLTLVDKMDLIHLIPRIRFPDLTHLHAFISSQYWCTINSEQFDCVKKQCWIFFLQEFPRRAEQFSKCGRHRCARSQVFIISVQRHWKREKARRSALHQGAAALKYAADAMNEQTKSIIINITGSVNLLKLETRSTASYTRTQIGDRRFSAASGDTVPAVIALF